MNRNEFKETLEDLKEFVGPEWLEDERAAAGTIPDPMTTHPLVYAWQQTSKYLVGHRVPGLDTTPRQQFLHLMMFTGHVKNVKACPVVDSENRRVDMTPSKLYQRRLQDGASYRSAVYELQVAGAHIRQGYSLSFIHDNSVPTREFQLELPDGRVYVECKRIEKRKLSRKTSEALSQVQRKVIKLLQQRQQRVGIVLLLEQDLGCSVRDIMAPIKHLLSLPDNPAEERWPGHVLKKIPLPASTTIPTGRADLAMQHYYEQVLSPHLRGYLEGAEILKENFQPAVTVSPRGQTWEAERGFWGGVQVLPNLILGIENSLKSASSQIPKGSAGVVYVEGPPYNATDDEIAEFQRAVLKRLNATTRVLALVLTGTCCQLAKIEHFSGIILNEACTVAPPAGFEVMALQETYTCG
jgi:hypothetical protein